jgi:hypothetical protein
LESQVSCALPSDRVKENHMKRFALLLFLVIGLGVASAAPWRSAKDRTIKCTSGDCFPVVPQVVVGEKPLANPSTLR